MWAPTSTERIPHGLYGAIVEWFTLDVPADIFRADSSDNFDAEELAFVAALRARAAAWPVLPFLPSAAPTPALCFSRFW